MAEAWLYFIVKVARNEDLMEQIGKDRYFDLVDHNKVHSFRIERRMPVKLFKEEVAKEFGIPVQFQRFWLWAKRKNNTYRPHRHVTRQQEAQPVGQLREGAREVNDAELNLFLEVELGWGLQPIPPPVKSARDILLFFKLYDPLKEELRYVGRLLVKGNGRPLEILAKLNELAGFSPDEEVELFEEIKFEPNVMCERINKKLTLRGGQLEDGDIICFQKSPQVESSEQCRYPDVPSFLEYVHNQQVVRFRSLKIPKEDEFCLEFSKLHNYDKVVERVAHHLGLDDPSKIRLTAHNCYFQQPMPQPIEYREVEHLSDMLVHGNRTSDILYYEVLDIPLPELQGLKTLEVAFHHSTKDEVVLPSIRLPKQSTIGDYINDLKTKVELSHPNAELRLLEIYYHKINRIIPLNEKIENVKDQKWSVRAEEIPEEEKNLGPHDRLIHVYHFMKETSQNEVQVQNFGRPFLLVIREGETLAEVKVRIQKKLQVPDEEFSKWKFALLSLSLDCPDYLQDSDIVSNRFQRRHVYGAWDQYLGLEHSEFAPKRSYAANQIKPKHQTKRRCCISSEPKLTERVRGTISVGSTTQTHSANAPAGKVRVRFLAYWVSSEASLLLERILNIHKDTYTNFSMKDESLGTVLLESFASFIEKMSTTKVYEVQEDVARRATASVEEFEQFGLELSWLKKRLEEAKKVNKCSQSLICVDLCETALKVGRAKVRELEEGLVKATAELENWSTELPNSLAVNDKLLTDVV